MGFHQIWKLHQVVGWVGREKEEKKKKNTVPCAFLEQ